jgi:hypothetical protein
LETYFKVAVGIIIIFKHATTLCASGYLSKAALTQAELDFQKSNVDSKVASYFTAPPQEYSSQQFVDFIMDVHVGLFFKKIIKIISNKAYSSIQLICYEREFMVGYSTE